MLRGRRTEVKCSEGGRLRLNVTGRGTEVKCSGGGGLRLNVAGEED